MTSQVWHESQKGVLAVSQVSDLRIPHAWKTWLGLGYMLGQVDPVELEVHTCEVFRKLYLLICLGACKRVPSQEVPELERTVIVQLPTLFLNPLMAAFPAAPQALLGHQQGWEIITSNRHRCHVMIRGSEARKLGFESSSAMKNPLGLEKVLLLTKS